MTFLFSFIVLGYFKVFGFRPFVNVKQLILPRNQALSAIRLLIQGTKNAYTNLQAWDCVLFQIKETEDGKDKALGYITNDSMVHQLCVKEINDAEFHPYSKAKPISAQKLVDEKRLLRIVSSDRCKEVFTIDEYLGNDVYIPLENSTIESTVLNTTSSIENVNRSNLESVVSNNFISIADSNAPATDNAVANTGKFSIGEKMSTPDRKSNYFDEDIDIDIVRAKLKVAHLELKLLQLQKMPVDSFFKPSSDSLANDVTKDKSQNEYDRNSFIPLKSSTPSHVSSTFVSESLPSIYTDFSFAKVTVYQNIIYISGCHGIDGETYSLSKTGIQDDFMKAIPSTFSFESQVREAFKNLQYILQKYCKNNNKEKAYNYNHEEFKNPIYNLCSITIILNNLENSGIVKRLFTVMFTPSSDLQNDTNEMKLKLPNIRFIQSPIRLAYDADLEIDAIATVV